MPYTTITTEGGLLPADILDAIAAGELEGQRPEDFGLERARNLSDRISAAWQAARGQWALFQSYLADLPAGETGTSETREQWVLPLLRILGYQLVRNRSAYVVQGRTYAISHRIAQSDADDGPPVHIESIRASLDARPPSGRPRLSPHALVQEYLNNTEQLWGIVTNGERLRLLRDSSRFTRPTYVEFDLRAMFEGEHFSEFALLYRLLHRSRMPGAAHEAAQCLLERYHQRAVEAGGRVREGLRDGVERALTCLGNGLLRHPANHALRARLGLVEGTPIPRIGQIDAESAQERSDPRTSVTSAPAALDRLTPEEFYRQLLRLVYRLIFLMVAEDRELIRANETNETNGGSKEEKEEKEKKDDEEGAMLSPGAYLPAPERRLAIYREHYSIARLRRLAETSGAGRGPYGDLWLGLLTTFRLFEGSDELAPRRLGLAPLGGDLFGPDACPDLVDGTRLANLDLLHAIRALSLYAEPESKTLRRVNYGALDVEELGSVYESLLDYRPVIRDEGRGMRDESGATPAIATSSLIPHRSSFDLVSGTERKTTGSYYTRPELVNELIASALVPVLEERLRAAREHLRAAPAPGAKPHPSAALTPHPSPLTPQHPSSLLPPSSLIPHPSSLEEAILSIRVCDPACGSGHFLLAAARRLGRELAKVRAGEEQPSPTQFRLAVRDVIRRCIFGVDLNPLAVDLCKLALWLESHSAGMPLSFLDHHIRCGNSLVGATRALVEAGIPDEAYKPVSGDDKATASSIKKRNKQERELALKQGLVQRDMFAAAPGDHALLAGELRALDETGDDNVAAARARAARYAALRRRADAERARFDLWTAAFFQPLTTQNARYVPTTRDLIDFDPTGEKALMAAPLAQDVGFFHWELEFPQVFEGLRAEGGRLRESAALGSDHQPSPLSPQPSGGFDVVLGNPPWERIKLQEQEHFVDVPEIAGAANKAEREKKIQEWRASHDPQRRARIARFDAAKHRAEAESRFVRASGRFPLTAVGDVNTYALFAEHCRGLLAPAGRAGIIVPTGIATDDSTKAFFGDLSATRQLISLYDFENREKIFADVDSRYKFCLLTIGTTQQPARLLCFATNVGQLADARRAFSLTPAEIALINPNTRTAPVFRTANDAELTKQIYRRAPVLVNELSGENPWGVSFRQGLFNMTSDSGLFKHEPAPDRVPLYEAKLLHQYTHRWATYGRDEGRGMKDEGGARELTAEELADPALTITPRYWVPAAAVEERLAGRWTRGWLLGWRDITNATNERTMIATIFPRYGCGDKFLLMMPDTNTLHIAALLATLNSLVFDYVTRQKVGGTSLKYFTMKQLPVLPPSAFIPQPSSLIPHPSAFILPRVLELVYTAWDIKAFAEDVWKEAGHEMRERLIECWRENIAAAEELAASNPAVARHLAAAHAYAHAHSLPHSHIRSQSVFPPFIWHEARRARIRAELDAHIARLYGLTRDELRYILDPADVYGPDFPGETFRVLKEKEQRMYGEYRTRRLVLEAWDREDERMRGNEIPGWPSG